MLVLKTIGTGSKGNSYAITGGESILLLDCGLNISNIKKAIGFRVSDVVGCIVSHEHL